VLRDRGRVLVMVHRLDVLVNERRLIDFREPRIGSRADEVEARGERRFGSRRHGLLARRRRRGLALVGSDRPRNGKTARQR
jgi:hypothetical protein